MLKKLFLLLPVRRSFFIGVLLLHLPVFLSAQLFLPIDDDPFGVSIKFNPDSIRHDSIFSITANLQYKPDGEIIIDKGLKEYYRFDSLGRMQLYWRTRVSETKATPVMHPAYYRHGRKILDAYTDFKNSYTYDTIFIYYYYDNNQHLVCRRECDGDFYSTWYYIYNTDGTIARQTRCHETNVGPDHDHFHLGVQTLVSQEDFSYQHFSPTQIKQTCLNDEGKPYKETMMLFDAKLRPIEWREAFVTGGIRTVTSWSYDDKGRTSGWTYSSNAGEDYHERAEFYYDSLGRINSVKRFVNDSLKDEFSYLYDKNSPVAYAYINRRHIELAIDIVKLDIIYRKTSH